MQGELKIHFGIIKYYYDCVVVVLASGNAAISILFGNNYTLLDHAGMNPTSNQDQVLQSYIGQRGGRGGVKVRWGLEQPH